MFCHKCGKELVEDSQFCTSCGTEIEVPSTAGVPEPRPEQVTQPQAVMPGAYPAPAGKKNGLIVGIVIVAALLVTLPLCFAVGLPLYLNSQKNARTRTCQANLRTIDGVINAYIADTGKNPDSIETLVQEGYLKKFPTCPSGDLPYELRGEPLEAFCPNNPSHTL